MQRQARRRYTHVSWLDRSVYRFQDRWETNAQYRAMVSGLAAVALVILLCAGGALGTAVANAALASVGLGGASQGGQANTGTGNLQGYKSFPTPTVGATPGSQIQQAPIPNSQTPQPNATATVEATISPSGGPTSTPCTSYCGSTVSGSISPSTWITGQVGSITIQTSQPNIQFALLISLPGAPQATKTGTTDGNGSKTISYQIPSTVTSGTGDILITAQFQAPATTTVSVPCSTH